MNPVRIPTVPVALHCEPPVATVRLHDRAGRNRLSAHVREGVADALARASGDPEIRVIVLEGLPEVFCAGGSVEQMLGGRRTRIDAMWEFLRGVLACPVPVVAAAQGHALGGGFLLALYCDVTVLSDRSRYAANFLAYGFTPILGATYLLPAALGTALGSEVLYSARSYRGAELARRGAGVTVAEHDDVPDETQRLAVRIAHSPKDVLRRLKGQLVQHRLAEAEAALEREIPDHEATIADPESRRMIRGLHGERLSRPHRS